MTSFDKSDLLASHFTIVYAAYGPKHLAEASCSIEGLLQHNPDVSVIVYTDQARPSWSYPNCRIEYTCSYHGYLGKILALKRSLESGSGKVIFLDTDTYCCGSMQPILRMLDVYPVAAAYDPLVNSLDYVRVEIPPGWCRQCELDEYNSGVIGINNTSESRRLCELWYKLHLELTDHNQSTGVPDQISFLQALLQGNTAIGVLPPEINYRACYPGVLRRKPTIIHSRIPDAKTFARRLGRMSSMSITFPFGIVISARSLMLRAMFFLYRKYLV